MDVKRIEVVATSIPGQPHSTHARNVIKSSFGSRVVVGAICMTSAGCKATGSIYPSWMFPRIYSKGECTAAKNRKG